MLSTRQAPIELGNEKHPFSMLLAKGAGAHLTEGGCFLPTHVTLVPRTLPLPCWSFGQIETVCMVNFRAAWLLAGDELTTISTAETFILSLLGDFTLASALPMWLPLEFPGLFFCDNGLILWPHTQEATAVRGLSLIHI